MRGSFGSRVMPSVLFYHCCKKYRTNCSEFKMLETVELHKRYRSTYGYLFQVMGIARHAQDCSVGMVIYVALEPTFDAPSGSLWVLEESLFLKRFKDAE